MRKIIIHTEIKSQIKSKGIKQADIAKAVGCTQGHISRLLNGEVAEDSRLYKKVAEFVFQDQMEKSNEGQAILDLLIDDCWDGSLEQALIFDDIIRNAIKLTYLN
jgi:transcriptional regulator with XRE-family HTH domain